MSKRTELAYTAVFKYIHDSVLTLKCRFVMTDYEVAMRNALRSVVEVDMHACHFHYAQALNRKAKKFPGLIQLIYHDTQALALYRKLLCLPLLPADRIVDTFNAIALVATNQFPNKFNDFLRYIQRQWLTRVSYDFTIFLILNID